MNYNILDFLEIGCNLGTQSIYNKLHREYNHDFIFMTSIGDRVQDGTYGFSIDPVYQYLENFNTPPSVNKINCAISNKNGESEVFYIDVNDAINNKIYSWLIGCATLNQPNKKIIEYLDKNNLKNMIKSNKIKVLTPQDIVNIYNILYIDYLKIDTEGEDYNILLSFFEIEKGLGIDKIQFESKERNDKFNEIYKYLKSKNFIDLYVGHDSFFIAQKSLSRILTNPTELDKIFLQDLKYNLDIKI